MSPSPLPLDVRLMNATAGVLFAGVFLFALVALLGWAARHPAFDIRAIVVDGEVTHNNAVTLRANVAPRLRGNFFTIDLKDVRVAFEAVPWVRRAFVRREFPYRLHVTLEEFQPVALWARDDTDVDARLIDRTGVLFDANLGDVDVDALPRLWGPPQRAAEILATLRALRPLFAPLDAELVGLDLTERGQWRAELDNGGRIELGRGEAAELIERSRRFVATAAQVAARYHRSADAIEAADLRYPRAYALRLKGVTTVSAALPSRKGPAPQPQTKRNG
ncbi:cell division protein FtsQ/DivIB [Tibeticola sp.]|jgi:cell division protein FtsQ|uniref:cell division protein FtsQ/DivIB n=1 Tax=Tibeticola sp. TaxID=2005368 RepID=UPI002583AA4A|nr:cell division protein FtsQ/DivIB [Tibeticola sp.]MCI4439690.1 cell division protein FtsQ/DivIB [Tibeticola sp.]